MLSFYVPSKKRLRTFFDDDFDFFDNFDFPEIDVYRPARKYMKRLEKGLDVKFKVEETDEGKLLKCKLPKGFDSNNIKINIDVKRRNLDISLLEDKEWKSEDGNSFKKTKTEIRRSFPLDEDCDTKNIKSTFANNELIINLPFLEEKKENDRVVEIPIEIVEN